MASPTSWWPAMWRRTCRTACWSGCMGSGRSCWWTGRMRSETSSCCEHTAVPPNSTAPSRMGCAMSTCRVWPWSLSTSVSPGFSG
uniref:Alternative protein ETNK2 n=1 Tax=Homo sapiens TaxID=9606 RepID=L8ECH7_HUMAN|nr:alternative protein ETNK2 [Homo sapiens]